MTAPVSLIADRLFEAGHLMFESRDLDEVVDNCTRALRPHRLLLHGARPRLETRLHHLRVGPVSLNRLRYGTDVTVAPAVPEEDNFLVVLPLGGKARFRYGRDGRDVAPGRGAIVGPYHPFRFDIDARFDQIILRLDRRRVETIAADLAGAGRIDPVHFDLALEPMPDFWHKLLETVVVLGLAGGHAAPSRLLGHFEDVVIETLLLNQPNSASAGIAAASRPAPTAQIRRAMDYMRERPGEPVRLGAVARHCGLSLRGLQLGFRRDLGVAPARWWRGQRLDQAHAALLEAVPGTVSVTDIAMQSGFFHPGEFAAQFKARFGERPSDVLGKNARTDKYRAE